MTRHVPIRHWQMGYALLFVATSSCASDTNSGSAVAGFGGVDDTSAGRGGTNGAGSGASSARGGAGGASSAMGGASGANDSSGASAGRVSAGGVSAGGNDTGGNNTGGDNTAGVATGGNGAGGNSAGGNGTGGNSTGGNGTGGNGTGGATSGHNTGGNNSAGAGTGGVAAAIPCQQDTLCSVETEPPGCAQGFCRAGVCGFLPIDMDGDGYGSLACVPKQPVQGFLTGRDCDDRVKSTSPGADEVCNGVDDDCDGAIDRFRGTQDSQPSGLGATFQCVNATWYATEWYSEGDVGPSNPAPLGPVLVQALRVFDSKGEPVPIPGLPTTLFRIERVTHGPAFDHTIFRLDFSVLAAMPSAGRSTLQKVFAEGATVQCDVPIDGIQTYGIWMSAISAPLLLP